VDPIVLSVFIFVYAGMTLGGIPGLALDRTGLALVGAIALLLTGRVAPHDAWEAVDVPTIALLFGLMIVSAQFRLGGFYTAVTRRIAGADASPPRLLALVVATAGILSALLANDIICLAMAPVLLDGCVRRRLNPLPFLLALACASNVGSAATLIGNPQNMLIGQTLQLSFSRYLFQAFVPSALGLAATWAIITSAWRSSWQSTSPPLEVSSPPFNPWQTGKGLAVLSGLVVVFLWGGIPREVAALAAAGLLLMSRRMASREMLALVDWHLLVLFMGLFIVNHALQQSGALEQMIGAADAAGIDLHHPGWLFGGTVVLSNVVSNVPAVMLLLPSATHPLAGPILALASTLAGNLIIVGSIANIIVVDQAAQLGVRITWRRHAAIGIPVTLLTLAIAAAWLAFL
jgi:Na+/H+ antiporter NhaD/arsenite permease-like protein